MRRLVGTKSIGEDLSEQLERSMRTSSLVMEGMKSIEIYGMKYGRDLLFNGKIFMGSVSSRSLYGQFQVKRK